VISDDVVLLSEYNVSAMMDWGLVSIAVSNVETENDAIPLSSANILELDDSAT